MYDLLPRVFWYLMTYWLLIIDQIEMTNPVLDVSNDNNEIHITKLQMYMNYNEFASRLCVDGVIPDDGPFVNAMRVALEEEMFRFPTSADTAILLWEVTIWLRAYQETILDRIQRGTTARVAYKCG